MPTSQPPPPPHKPSPNNNILPPKPAHLAAQAAAAATSFRQKKPPMPSPPLSSPPTATKADQEVSFHKYLYLCMHYTVNLTQQYLAEHNKPQPQLLYLFQTTLTFHFYMHSNPFVFYSLAPFLFRSKI